MSLLVQTGEILSVADGFAPLDVAPTGPTGDGEVGHVGGVGRTVPMPDAKLVTNRVSLADPYFIAHAPFCRSELARMVAALRLKENPHSPIWTASLGGKAHRGSEPACPRNPQPTTTTQPSTPPKKEQNMNNNDLPDVDLSGIAPELRPVVRRRLRAIRKFEREPGRTHAEELARDLGLGTAQFYNLVKAWRNLRDPQRLSGQSRPRKRIVDLEPGQVQLIDETISAMPDSAPDEIVKAAIERGATDDVELPGAERIKRYVIANSAPRLPAEITALGDLIVEHTVLDLPIAFRGDATSRPTATMMFDTSDATLCGLSLSEGKPTVADIARAIMQCLPVSPRMSNKADTARIAIPRTADGQWDNLCDPLGNAGIVVSTYRPGPYGHGRCTAAIFGRLANGITFRPRLVEFEGGRRKMRGQTAFEPLTPEEGEKLVSTRLGLEQRTGILGDIAQHRLTQLRSTLCLLSHR